MLLAASSPRLRSALHGSDTSLSSERLAVLVQALDGRRLVEPRLTGGFAHEPCRPGSAKDDPLPEPSCSKRDIDRAELREWAAIHARMGAALASAPMPERLHAEAIAKLLFGGSAAAVEEAVRGLRKAHGLAPGNHEIVSDLAAAHIVRAARQDDPRDLLAAVAWSEEALRLEPAAAEARFNLALALEKLHLDSQARAVWSELMRAEADSPWAVEASQRRGSLTRPSVGKRWEATRRRLAAEPLGLDVPAVRSAIGDLVQQTRLYLEDEGLPAWADAAAAGDRAAASALLRAATVAEALALASGDRLLHDAVALIAKGSSASRDAKLRHLIDGHRLYREARRLYEEQNHDAARPLLERARAELAAGDSPLALWTSFYIAVCDYHASDYSLALQELAALLDRIADSPYPSLRAHAEWMVGLTQLDQARYADAVLAFQRALAGFRAAREVENAAAMHNLLSRGFEALGDDAEAWRHRYAALASLADVGKDRRLNNILSSAVDGAIDEGWPSVAQRFQDEMVRQARISGNPLLTAIALHKKASLAAQLGRAEEAQDALAEARVWCERIPGSGVRARVTADLLMAEGEVVRDRDPDASLASLERSLALFREQGARVRLVTAERHRARTLEAKGDADGAGAAYRAAIAEAEAQLGAVPRTELLAFAAETRRLYDDFIAFAADRQDAGEIFSWCEKARTSYLRAALAALRSEAGLAAEPADSPAGIHEAVRKVLPAGAVFVEYKLLPDRLLRWTLRSTSTGFRQVEVDPAALARSVSSLRAKIRAGKSLADLRAPLARLGELALGDMEEDLATGSLLVVIPDGPLTGLPFDLLPAPGKDRPLVESLPILSAPSAGLFLASSARSAALGGAGARTVLSLGNPSFERGLFPSLAPLPGAAAEARQIAAVYSQFNVLTGSAATRAALERQGPASDVIHFATHAVLNGRDVWRSNLLLARDASGGDSGALTVADLARLRLPRTRLVVLAACETAGRDTTVSDGVPALLLPFLAAGVPNLVASLWEVDDVGASSLLFEEFHRRVAAGQSPAAALHQAKLLLFHSSEGSLRAPAAWAAFTLVGGVTSI